MDDDPRVRAGLAGVLGATPGLSVAAVTGSSRRALVVASAGAADVALVDALLPRLTDGVRLVRRLSLHLPVVAISLDGTSRSAVLAAGAVAYVEKDGAVEQLVATLVAVSADGHERRDQRTPHQLCSIQSASTAGCAVQPWCEVLPGPAIQARPIPSRLAMSGRAVATPAATSMTRANTCSSSSSHTASLSSTNISVRSQPSRLLPSTRG